MECQEFNGKIKMFGFFGIVADQVKSQYLYNYVKIIHHASFSTEAMLYFPQQRQLGIFIFQYKKWTTLKKKGEEKKWYKAGLPTFPSIIRLIYLTFSSGNPSEQLH